jgi:hypothetical protein
MPPLAAPFIAPPQPVAAPVEIGLMTKPVRWQYRPAMKLAWMLVVAAAACTRPNPAVCCLDQADCDEVGISEVRDCSAGLACVEHQCVVPSCAMTGCEVAAPVCNLTTDVCEGCTDSSECSRFPDANVCDTMSGGCVECVAASDCPAEKPVCDANVCRACTLDTDCASGACGDDGACLSEDAVVYLDPGGNDAGSCTRGTPCRTLNYGVSQTSPTRMHLVLAPGGYIENNTSITAQSTTADRIAIHGHGASVTSNGVEAGVLLMSLAATLKDLEIVVTGNGTALTFSVSAFVLERVRISGANVALDLSSSVNARDLVIDDCSTGISLQTSAQLTLDRSTISNTARGINAVGLGTNVQITNLLMYGGNLLALDLTKATGTLASSTIADSGTDSGTGPRAIACSSAVTIRSSVVWAPGTVTRVAVEGCNLVSSIIGPTPVPGAMNVDPGFVDPAARNYHLAANSPARDAVDSGPSWDFEGDIRPQGIRYDIGADEAGP